MNIRRKIGNKLLNQIIDKLPDKETIMQNIEQQYMEIECKSEITGEKVSFSIARRDRDKFMNFLKKIEDKAKHY
jgi:DNA polymerase III sliding clamp (beta) subunit (PCNA family)